MSYIRCLSNPEGLYIWHDVDGELKVAHKAKLTGVSVGDFEKALRAWKRYGDASLPYESETFDVLASRQAPYSKVILVLKPAGSKKVRIPVWYVTWDYVSRHARKRRRIAR